MLWSVSVALAEPLVAVVVIDQEARDQGYALELEGWVVEDALPVDVAPGEVVQLVDPDGGRHPLDTAPGEAWEIGGPSAEAWMSRLGDDVRTDLLLVRGDDDAVRALARALEATVRAEDGVYVLARDGLLYDAPWADTDARDRIDEVRLVPTDARQPGTQVATQALPLSHASGERAGVRGATLAPMGAPQVARAETPVPTRDLEGDSGPEPVPDRAKAEEPRAHETLDPVPYFGVHLCGDGAVVSLTAGGFSTAGVTGEWFVSAPGVVRLLVGGAVWGRAAFDVDRGYCRATFH